MRRTLPRAAAFAAFSLALGLASPAPAQQSGRPTGRAEPEKPGAPPVIGCPSLANYRVLMQAGPPAAAALLADPKADHLGCAALLRGRITGIADRVALGGQNYDCVGVQGTTACHWVAEGLLPAAPGRGGR